MQLRVGNVLICWTVGPAVGKLRVCAAAWRRLLRPELRKVAYIHALFFGEQNVCSMGTAFGSRPVC